jgi:hypothetical protein
VIGLTDRKSLQEVLCLLVVAACDVCHVGYVRYVSERVGLEVVVLLCNLRYVCDVCYVSQRVALDFCLFLGSLAVLILHSVLLSHY